MVRRILLICVLSLFGCDRAAKIAPEPLQHSPCGPISLEAPAFEIPRFRGHVSDYAEFLTLEQEAKLASISEALEKDIGSQLALLTISSLPPSVSIEKYSLTVSNSWGVGRRDFNDGVLITVAVDNKSLRIEVGCGLELAIPDAVAKQIIDDMIPEFRAARAFEGLEHGARAIAQRIKDNRALVGRTGRPGPLQQQHKTSARQ